MTRLFWTALLLSPAALGAISTAAVAAGATDGVPPADPSSQLNVYGAEGRGVEVMDQVTSVSQLTDVRPTDWAFQALQSLVERYGCIVGYPDRTYRGNRALTRYEFAAGLNACIDRVNELIAAATADLVKKEDLATLQRLQEEFRVELITLRGRVDALEARATTLERQQFSTTTKLNGEVVLAISGVLSGDQVNGRDVEKGTIFSDRVRLNFDTSFTGRDLLRTRIQAANTPLFSETATFTREGDLRFAGDTGNQAGIDALLYQFPLSERTTVTLEANAGAIDDFTNTINPFFDGDGATGALSHFGTRNPIYYLLNGAGIGIQHEFSDSLELSLGYLANSPNDPSGGSGLFNGPYGAIAQITFKPSEAFTLGLTYINAYNNDFTANGSTGSTQANFVDSTGLPFSVNAFGIGASFQFSPNIVLNGSVGYTIARSVGAGFRGEADIWNWSVGLAFPDLGRKGNVLGVIVGMEPKVTGVDGNLGLALSEDADTSLHVEGFYQFQLTDSIAITPGVIWLTAPDHNSANEDVVIGTVRTTFTF
ncbi:iron uptake porin [Leptolyngbya sp. FACHB-36]|uniref:iron uptake porin n=1 Tax=Leptolyngbya sp. FACHB-36 TaxID=2692808 RepID=UPI00167FEBC7|nr:iron uptake porin [Leptolyngbya sp. FACHB-36]MBD2021707.1 iron uptake porin [Leptolyngbya sp. FACHB-36]